MHAYLCISLYFVNNDLYPKYILSYLILSPNSKVPAVAVAATQQQQLICRACSFIFGLTSREETCCPPTTTLHSFLTAGQLLKRFSSKTNFYKVLSQTLKSLWGQGQARGVSEPRLGLLMEPALFRGGSVTRTINNKFSVNLGIFPENEPICQGKFG